MIKYHGVKIEDRYMSMFVGETVEVYNDKERFHARILRAPKGREESLTVVAGGVVRSLRQEDAWHVRAIFDHAFSKTVTSGKSQMFLRVQTSYLGDTYVLGFSDEKNSLFRVRHDDGTRGDYSSDDCADFDRTYKEMAARFPNHADEMLALIEELEGWKSRSEDRSAPSAG